MFNEHITSASFFSTTGNGSEGGTIPEQDHTPPSSEDEDSGDN